MAKISIVKSDAVEKFFNKYGKKLQDVIIEADTKLINMGSTKKLTPEQLKQTAMSIDALENLTSLDFFCAMPDEYESNIEATFNESKWTW